MENTVAITQASCGIVILKPWVDSDLLGKDPYTQRNIAVTQSVLPTARWTLRVNPQMSFAVLGMRHKL
jgi:hypothetical protein